MYLELKTRARALAVIAQEEAGKHQNHYFRNMAIEQLKLSTADTMAYVGINETEEEAEVVRTFLAAAYLIIEMRSPDETHTEAKSRLTRYADQVMAAYDYLVKVKQIDAQPIDKNPHSEKAPLKPHDDIPF